MTLNYQNDALLRLLQSDVDTVRGVCGGVRGSFEGCGRGSALEAQERGGSCGEEGNGVGECLAGTSLAMVYSPVQRFQNLYEPEEALCRGTLFQELEKPFLGGRGK